jgi:hypothetical protein
VRTATVVCAALCGLLVMAPAATLADRGGGSIRAAGRAGPVAREPARVEPARVEPARVVPERVIPEARPEVRAAPPPPARRDWDDHDVDVTRGGGLVDRAPVHAIRGQRLHDLPHHVEIRFDNRVYFCDDDGNYYLQEGPDYVVVQPPVGVPLTALPPGAVAIPFGPTTYYYADGIFYVAQGGAFAVVNPPPGIVVTELPTGATQVVIDGNVCYQFNGFTYAPSVQDGVTDYTVTPS